MAENKQRGLLRVVTDIGAPTPVETSSAVFTQPDTGLTQVASQVSADFSRIGEKVGRLADHAAAVEGAQEGRQAGLDPEFRPSRQMTIRGEAYDKAGLDVYRTKQELALTEELDKAYKAHRGDPAKLDAAISQVRSSWLQHSLPETRPDLDVSFQKHRLTLMRQAARDQEERVRHEAAAAAQESVAASLKTIQQRAYSLGLDPKADEVLASDLSGLKATLSRRGPDGNPLVPPEAAGKLLRAAREEVATARLMGAFSRLPDVESKTKFLEGLRGDFAKGEGLAKEYDLDGLRRVEHMLSAEMSKEVTRVGAEERAVKHEVDQLFQMAGKGFGPPADQMSALAAKVTGLRNPEVAATFDEARDLMAWHAQARTLTPDQLSAHVEELRTMSREQGAGPRLVRRIEIGDKLLETMRGQIKTDPLGWAKRSGLVPDVAPLDFSTPERAALTLSARIGQAEELAKGWGIQPKYLQPDEISRMGAHMAKGGKELHEVTLLLSAAGDRAPAILRQLGDHAPAMAYLGGLTSRVPDSPVAADAAAGLALRKTLGDEFKSLAGPARDIRAAALDVAGASLGRLQVNMQAAMDVATAAYEVRARRMGLKDFDAEMWKKGFREALGERTVDGETYGGVYKPSRGIFSSAPPIVLPHDVSPRKFDAVIEAIRVDDLKDGQGRVPVGRSPSGKEIPLSIADIRAGTLVTVGPGRYRVALGDPESDPQWVMRGGAPLVIDVHQMTDLRRRRADLFLGGEPPRHDGEPAR